MSKAVGAYLHCKPDGTPFYVGKGTVKRSRDFYTARSTWHKNTVRKYGRPNILIEFMECSNESFAFLLEEGLIKTLTRNGFKLCNLSSGGEGGSGWKVGREVVERISAKNRGRVQSAEERAMRSDRLKGIKKSVPMSDEHRAKLGLLAKGKRWYNNGQNVVFCLEGMQPEGYTLGRKSNKLCKEK
jgi:hypothetical protein